MVRRWVWAAQCPQDLFLESISSRRAPGADLHGGLRLWSMPGYFDSGVFAS